MYICTRASPSRTNASPSRTLLRKFAWKRLQTAPCMRYVRSYHSAGQRAHCPANVMPFWNFRDELSVEDGLIRKAQRIILPEFLHTRITRTCPLCTLRCRKMQASCKSSGFLVSYQLWHKVANTKEALNPNDVPKRA